MRRILVAVRENLQNMRKSSRVADENMLGDNGNGAALPILAHRPRHGWNGFTVICSIVRAPLALLSCLSHPRISSADGVWMSGEFGRISEMNHLMVNDSMRYAILM
ncbi:uncharacterized protein LOC141705391 [Apium graveolens]|uniref:uncharacterized protein LOC141705391 n=1 Tax=Apium graveolens TaxID=4045 RepID=UPI003D7BB798